MDSTARFNGLAGRIHDRLSAGRPDVRGISSTKKGRQIMDTKRSTPEQKMLDFAIHRTKAWHDAANRAEIRGETSLAIYYRNQAWRIENGKEWLDDVSVTAPLPPRVSQ